jgi:hypothetical protein
MPGVLAECVKRFREQPPAPAERREALPFRQEDFWWKANNDGEGDDVSRLSESFDESRSFRQSLTLSVLSATSSMESFGGQNDAAMGDLDQYASSLLAKCESLMQEYETRSRQRLLTKEQQDAPPALKKDDGSSLPDGAATSTSTPSPSKTSRRRAQQPQQLTPMTGGSADSVFPLYVSSSDDRSGSTKVVKAEFQEPEPPLTESAVSPYLGDEVVKMLWQRLLLVRLEISKTTSSSTS